MKMLIKCIQLYVLPELKGDQKYSLREVLVNPDYVVDAKEDIVLEELLKTNEKLFPQGMDLNQKFTTLFLTNKMMVVVGQMEEIIKKINKSERILLKG